MGTPKTTATRKEILVAEGDSVRFGEVIARFLKPTSEAFNLDHKGAGDTKGLGDMAKTTFPECTHEDPDESFKEVIPHGPAWSTHAPEHLDVPGQEAGTARTGSRTGGSSPKETEDAETIPDVEALLASITSDPGMLVMRSKMTDMTVHGTSLAVKAALKEIGIEVQAEHAFGKVARIEEALDLCRPGWRERVGPAEPFEPLPTVRRSRHKTSRKASAD